MNEQKRDIHDGIEQWHTRPEDGVSLHYFLGLSWTEYERWAAGGSLPSGCDWYDGQRAADALIDKILREP